MERYLPIDLIVDGRAIASDTTAFAAGPRVIVLRTASAEAELLLYSTYAGHDELDAALCTEIVELGNRAPELLHRDIAVGSGAFTYSRRFALYDHLQRLQTLVETHLGAELRYEGLEHAVRELDPAAV